LQDREWALTHISDEVRKQFRPQNTPSVPQIREDFHQLQVVNNELMRSVFVKNSVDSKQIIASITEMKKRATRLKASLAFGDSETKPERKTDAPNSSPAGELELSPALLLLDHAVMSFVKNPLFQQPKVLDSRLAIQAQNDLGDILRLAETINRIAKHTEEQK
jgi:hypothetical protein